MKTIEIIAVNSHFVARDAECGRELGRCYGYQITASTDSWSVACRVAYALRKRAPDHVDHDKDTIFAHWED